MTISELTLKSRDEEPVRRLEIFTGSGRRREWLPDEKARIVAESYEVGETVSAVARRYALDDLPGISGAMKARLERAGVHDIPALWRLDPRHARAIWRSVEGERFVRSLQGEPIPLLQTRRGGFGNGKVLAPEFRDPRSAYLVSRWLVEKAASRLRHSERVAASFSLYVAREGARSLRTRISCTQSQDSAFFLRINRQLWRDIWPQLRGQQLVAIAVQLGKVEYLDRRNGDLLAELPAAERTGGEKVSVAVDFLNGRFGAGTVTWGVNIPHPGFFERG